MAFNESEDKIEAVDKISKALDGKNPQVDEVERALPNREHFESLVDSQPQKPANTSNVQAVESTEKPGSLMDEVRKLHQQTSNVAGMNPEELKNRANGIIAQLEDVKTKLTDAQSLNPSYNQVLHNRLSHINDTIKIALSKAGVEYTPPSPELIKGNSPIQSFLGYLSHAQNQFENLNSTIDKLSLTGSQITPGGMLTLQMKIGYAQQQIELFTSLLNKALESTKTIMNVQV